MSPATLRDRIGYAFQEPALLARALTHRSHGAAHNERLEFVGDAVLNCVVAAALYRRLRDLPEGDLSRLRANLVNRDTLAQLARPIGLGALLRVGEGERRGGGGERPSIVADALEAVFGAVFLDGGYDAARAAIERVYGDLLAEADPRRGDAVGGRADGLALRTGHRSRGFCRSGGAGDEQAEYEERWKRVLRHVDLPGAHQRTRATRLQRVSPLERAWTK